MSVRAKFKCQSVTDFGNQKQVSLQPVVGKGSEDFSKYTPSGDLKMMITEETKAFDFFKPGKSYVLDFSEESVEA